MESTYGYIYQIKIKENLEPGFTDWFTGLTATPLTDGGTILVGTYADQAALRGFLDQLWNLNFTVLSVEQIGCEDDQSKKHSNKP